MLAAVSAHVEKPPSSHCQHHVKEGLHLLSTVGGGTPAAERPAPRLPQVTPRAVAVPPAPVANRTVQLQLRERGVVKRPGV